MFLNLFLVSSFLCKHYTKQFKERTHPIQTPKKGLDSFSISLLRSSKARFINPVIDIVVDPVIRLVDILFQFLRKELYVAVFGFDDIVELDVSLVSHL